MGRWARQGTNAAVREFDEEGDAGCIKMWTLAIWEADEIMNSRVSERAHPSIFPA
jgi:hypothetical protein